MRMLIDAGTNNACWIVCAKGDQGAVPVGVLAPLKD